MSKSKFGQERKTRILAMYLPQYHRTEENDLFWGEGYTEWTAVKNAKPLFEDHCQPRIPLHDNYYDLTDKSTMEWQAKLAKEYGIDGFCFYHYWFGKDRKVLEKPAENLLKWTDIDLPFCFCWDATTWARTWSAVGDRNAWNVLDENKRSESDDGVLIRQEFGDEDWWRIHFYYLLQFFADDRYIKVDGKPVFLFMNNAIPHFERMIPFWRETARKEGLPGLYLVTLHHYVEGCDAVIPWMRFQAAGRKRKAGCALESYSYDEVWKNYLLQTQSGKVKKLWHGVVQYDDTPRRGEKASLYEDVSPVKFQKYFAALYLKSIQDQNELVFADAWNEWGEGNYLEPDSRNKYDYLKAVQNVTGMTLQELEEYAGELCRGSVENEMMRLEEENHALRQRNILLAQWIDTDSDRLERYLQKRKVARIAIYGYGGHGRRLYRQLNHGKIEVSYAIDKNAHKLKHAVGNAPRIVGDEEELAAVDLIVVTVVESFVQIAEKLRGKVDCPILSLCELVYESNQGSETIL